MTYILHFIIWCNIDIFYYKVIVLQKCLIIQLWWKPLQNFLYPSKMLAMHRTFIIALF